MVLGGAGGSVAEQAKEALHRHVLEPLVMHAADAQDGGFLVDLDERWRPSGTQQKSLEHQARTTTAFARLHRVAPQAGCDRLARHGCDFLSRCMWDEVDGGFFVRVHRSGTPMWDGMKHPHGVVYAAQAFLECRELLEPGEGERWGERALAWLEEIAWDEHHDGYWGSYRRDNRRFADGERLPTSDGSDPLGHRMVIKEINTQSDALELAGLIRVEGPGRSGEHVERLIRLVTEELIEADGVLPYAYRRNWRPLPSLLRVGYQFATARRLAAIARDRGGTREELMASCRRLVEFPLGHARHPAGGFCMAVSAEGRSWPDTGQASDLRQWWVQFEALHALHALAREEAPESDRHRYRTELERHWSFVSESYFDECHSGVWEEPVGTSGAGRAAVGTMKSHPWKDASHEVSTLMALAYDRP